MGQNSSQNATELSLSFVNNRNMVGMKMKYALVNGERQEAQSGLSGKCVCCDSPVIAKCGKVKVRHWAYKGKLMCDPWWEETEWHRAWKGQFPKECQEIIHYAENGEKHISDVKINQGYVIEFQHSPIKPEERQAREDFYKKMVWIVDGTGSSREKNKFMDAKYSEAMGSKIGVDGIRSHFSKSALLRDWSDSRVPVFFDFGEEVLWCLWPKIYAKDNSIRITQLLEQEGKHLGKKLDVNTFLRWKVTERGYVFKVERNVLIRMLQADHFEAVCQGWGKRIVDYDNHLNVQSVLNEVQSQNANNAKYRPQQGRSRRL